ncbi:hypothetical protein RNJ44_02652 [Nakaseomyces bracarensis]|uniref:YMC020W-like alpha/beta hydrolase domain-containing protein n=1 Tax=Nakaseomyces bracarensis TaxID=273131 RepID=A0ABR4P010_9SACH
MTVCPYIEDLAYRGTVLPDGIAPVKCVVIGVHGFFPHKVVDMVIGQPTGTSDRFVAEARDAVTAYFESQGLESEVTTIALEKQGTVAKRVEFFYEVLQEYDEVLNGADFIYIVAHSQGVPVSIMLLAQLIETGILSLKSERVHHMLEQPYYIVTKKITILGMAGVNYGPLYGADRSIWLKMYSLMERKSLLELFEFQNPNTEQSVEYIRSLKLLLNNNVKITFVGSATDQVVPLYSSLAVFIRHPNIYRSLYYSTQDNIPEFLVRCICDALSLLNNGHDDHGFIKEISAYMLGPLTSNGHSQLYSEQDVYMLGIKHGVEECKLKLERHNILKESVVSLKVNPFQLPWSLRGLLGEVRQYLGNEELNVLYQLYDHWIPDSPTYKDLKFKINAIKSKL